MHACRPLAVMEHGALPRRGIKMLLGLLVSGGCHVGGELGRCCGVGMMNRNGADEFCWSIMVESLLFWDGVASSSSENARVQIRSSWDPSHGLLGGSHEAFNTGSQRKNGVLCNPVHHFLTVQMGAIGL